MLRVDPQLQCRINMLTNTKNTCKLQIVCRDKTTAWCEVRTAMRLVWSKEKREIIPVEVIFSFQLMQEDADSNIGMLAQLQKATGRGFFGLSSCPSKRKESSRGVRGRGGGGSSSSGGSSVESLTGASGSEGGCGSDGCAASDDSRCSQGGRSLDDGELRGSPQEGRVLPESKCKRARR
ncbi:unnamed protein product [Discosporangium mesarthrocarpum]